MALQVRIPSDRERPFDRYVWIVELYMMRLRETQSQWRGTQTALARCRLLNALASANRRSENVRILAIIIAKLELGDIERHVFGAHLVECANNASFEDRPKAVDCLSVHGTDHILPLGMINGRMWELFAKMLIPNPLIGTQQTHPVRYGFTREALKRAGLEIAN